ncbi:MAG: cysteine-rich CWC family protein [Nitrospirota bacterium]
MEKRCGNCGQAFSCSQAGGCWCGTIKLDRSQLAWIKQHFENCLCPDCLGAVAAGRLGRKGTPS